MTEQTDIMTNGSLREDFSYYLWVLSEILLIIGTVFLMKLNKGRSEVFTAVYYGMLLIVTSFIERVSVFVATGDLHEDYDPILERHAERGKGLLELAESMTIDVAEEIYHERCKE